MARKTNTEIPSFNEIFNNLSKDPGYYDRPEEERREARANSRLRKWGKRAVAGVLIGGAAFGIGKGIDSYNDSQNAKEHTMVQQLDREFGAKLEPVAKSIAKDVYKHVQKVDGHRGEKGFENKHASIIDDTADPSKLVLNYTVDVQGGSYTERATVAKKSNGEPDLDTVFEAEVSEQAEEETTDRPLLRNDIAVSHGNNSVYSESKFLPYALERLDGEVPII